MRRCRSDNHRSVAHWTKHFDEVVAMVRYRSVSYCSDFFPRHHHRSNSCGRLDWDLYRLICREALAKMAANSPAASRRRAVLAEIEEKNFVGGYLTRALAEERLRRMTGS